MFLSIWFFSLLSSLELIIFTNYQESTLFKDTNLSININVALVIETLVAEYGIEWEGYSNLLVWFPEDIQYSFSW